MSPGETRYLHHPKETFVQERCSARMLLRPWGQETIERGNPDPEPLLLEQDRSDQACEAMPHAEVFCPSQQQKTMPVV